MAVGLSTPSNLLPVAGVDIAVTAAGIRYSNRDDMVLMSVAEGSELAAVFTQNKFCAAPVMLAQTNMQRAAPRALLINAGNANAGTGEQGMRNAAICCQRVAERLGIEPHQVLPFSTGVIGEQLPMERVEKGINALTARSGDSSWLAAAKAIMTTDTVAKGASEQVIIDGHTVTLTGIAKGSGMICPDMATLLSYVATDAAVETGVLRAMLQRAADASFNRITIDSDTSTNDALVVVATGKSGLDKINAIDQAQAKPLYQALERLLIKLATAVIRDAEGATKFVKIEVINAESADVCRKIAYSVGHSPLVKTALFASDPNWGRLLMAIGKAQIDSLDICKLSISINDLLLIKNGEPALGYTEALGKAAFQQSEIDIVIDLQEGQHSFHIWTSDLSHDYVSINADYRS